MGPFCGAHFSPPAAIPLKTIASPAVKSSSSPSAKDSSFSPLLLNHFVCHAVLVLIRIRRANLLVKNALLEEHNPVLRLTVLRVPNVKPASTLKILDNIIAIRVQQVLGVM